MKISLKLPWEAEHGITTKNFIFLQTLGNKFQPSASTHSIYNISCTEDGQKVFQFSIKGDNEEADSRKPIPAHRPTCVCVCRLSLSVNPPSIKQENQFSSTPSLSHTLSLTHKYHVNPSDPEKARWLALSLSLYAPSLSLFQLTNTQKLYLYSLSDAETRNTPAHTQLYCKV